MQIELNAEQQRILERATKDGTSVEDVLNQAFAMIEMQIDGIEDFWKDLSPEERETVEAHIEEGCAQAERGELYTPEEAKEILAELKARRHVA
jgi:predicted transcriptional regulator